MTENFRYHRIRTRSNPGADGANMGHFSAVIIAFKPNGSIYTAYHDEKNDEEDFKCSPLRLTQHPLLWLKCQVLMSLNRLIA